MPNAWKLLIIDDCATDRKIYRRFLLKDPHHYYQIMEADSAEVGLGLCQNIPCDLILLDFCLPDMSGIEFLDQLRQKTFGSSVPVIMLTGRGDQEIAVQAMKRGVQDYLVKQHLKPDVLQLAVRNVIKQLCLQTQLQKTQERQRLIATMLLRIRQSLDLEEILYTAVREVQQLLKCDRIIVCQSSPEADSEQTGQNNSLLCYWAGSDDCNLNPLELLDSQENLIVPITLSDQQIVSKPWGFLIAHHCTEKREWQSDELEIMCEVSVQLAIAIQQAELLTQTQVALEKEKQLNAFKSQIITTISHEYRTPLASILAAASTLKQHGDHLEELKKHKFLHIIEQKARHMSKLIDDMLVMNQFELNKTKFKTIPLDLEQFFSSLISEQQQLVSDRHEFIFHSTGSNKGFCGDQGLLRLIFSNLMSNAIKYSPKGGNVEFHLIGKESEVIFFIQDQGIGIPIEEQSNLFQPFCRASNVDTLPGTGLGLAITKACVELHGGNISLDSQPNQGTKVTVCLPKQHIQKSSH
ncbi:MAG: response regulator [Pelatocladus maniniholoensis HA4357-MV3]|jgi:signal transduction histidine kinase|uniref:histidine kinase n=1 Tax=Pelatocladus maniniholoensis HA4357-MV3 TaxID=1117104 RepID=A0A9E3HB92_9NOST|nr:response regulator [Pelatocladus maniniholoensis HA4357-MV3]